MDNKITENLIQEFRRGLLVYIVLLHSQESIYGYSLVGKLEESGIPIEKNTLYPLLRRLEKQKLLDSNWNTEDTRPRKYYKISKEGLDVLVTLKDEWKSLTEKVDYILEEMK